MTTATAQPRSSDDASASVYALQGTLLEACSCNVLCPCWIGEDPDKGTCDAFIAYHFDKGTIAGVDVSGLSLVNVVQIPGNALTPKSWKVLMLVDEHATDEQMQALLNAYSGKLGGPLADLAQLIGEVIAVERAPIQHDVREGRGSLRVGNMLEAEMEPYHSAQGAVTTLRDSIFSTIPGSPAYVAKATRHHVQIPQHRLQWTFENRNAIQGDYVISYSG